MKWSWYKEQHTGWGDFWEHQLGGWILVVFQFLYIRSYFQSNLYVHPKKCGMWFYVNFCFLHGQNCMTSFQISYSLKVYHDDENWKKQQPTLHNVLGVDVHFQQHIKNSCILLLDVDFGLQNTGVSCCSVRHKLYSFCFGACIMIRRQMGCDWNMNIIQSEWL